MEAPEISPADLRTPGADLPQDNVFESPPERDASTRSTAVVALGVVVLGLGTYVYLAVCARALELSHFALLSVVVTAVITAGPGLFLPIEQEVSRGLAHRLAINLSGRSLIRKAAELGSIFAIAATAVIVGGAVVGLDRLLDGDLGLLLALACGVGALLPAYLSRGILAGSGHLTRYSVQLLLDGVLRAVGAGALAVAGVHTPWIYAALLTVAPLVAVACSMAGLSASDVAGPGRAAPITRRELAPALGYLVGASFAMQALANAGPIAVKVMSDPAHSAQAGRFLAALVLARSPLFVISALQATLVPAWAALLARGELAGMRRRVGRTLAGMAAFGLVMLPIAALCGPFALRVVYGAEYNLARQVILLLTAATGVYCVAVIASLALVALRQPAAVCGGWIFGFAVFVGCCFVPWPAAERVASALGIGALMSLLWFLVAIRRSVSR